MLYPIYCLLTTIIILELIENKKIIFLILIINLIPIISSIPYFYLYTNFLNFKNYTVTETWGFGGYELAQIMNKIPNAQNTSVWTDREGFNDFFIGESYWRGRILLLKKMTILNI
jgi:hypothetical protein